LIAEKWGWYTTIHFLAEAATEIEIESAFTFLSYEQDNSRKDKAPDVSQYR
jgi:hypothetical protein